MDAVPQVEIRPSVEFNIERARARLKSLPPPPTLKHASDADRELYMRTVETLENAASVRHMPASTRRHSCTANAVCCLHMRACTPAALRRRTPCCHCCWPRR